MGGVPSAGPSGQEIVGPPRFLHVEFIGGRWSDGEVGLSARVGGRRVARVLRRPRVCGLSGVLYFEIPHTKGGNEWGDHFAFLWRSHAVRYAVSLHSWQPKAASLAILRALVCELR